VYGRTDAFADTVANAKTDSQANTKVLLKRYSLPHYSLLCFISDQRLHQHRRQRRNQRRIRLLHAWPLFVVINGINSKR